MGCLRCGRDTENGKTFCPDCLASMDEYPVKPDEAIYLPSDRENAESKKQVARRKVLSQAQQLQAAKKQIRILWAVVLVQLVLIGALCAWIVF